MKKLHHMLFSMLGVNTLTVVVNGLVSSKDGVSVSLINARERTDKVTQDSYKVCRGLSLQEVVSLMRFFV